MVNIAQPSRRQPAGERAPAVFLGEYFEVEPGAEAGAHFMNLLLQDAGEDQAAAWREVIAKLRRELDQRAGEDVGDDDVERVPAGWCAVMDAHQCAHAIGVGVVARGDERLRINVEGIHLARAEFRRGQCQHT